MSEGAPQEHRINADYREEHVLADGTKVTLRLITPADAEPLRQGFLRLSPTSRYRRFLSGMSELSDDMLRYLTEVDGIDHVAVVLLRLATACAGRTACTCGAGCCL